MLSTGQRSADALEALQDGHEHREPDAERVVERLGEEVGAALGGEIFARYPVRVLVSRG